MPSARYRTPASRTAFLPPSARQGQRPATGTPTYHTVWIVDGDRVIRDETGTRIERIERTLMVSATGTAIEDEDMIAVGIAAEDASEATQWETIKEVRPVAPAGVVVYYSLVIDGAPGKLST